MNEHYVDRLSRTDRDLIISNVPDGSRVLDLGCGDCGLLVELAKKKKIQGVGLDIDGDLLTKGLAYGLSVYHGNLDDGLPGFPDQSFDYVIINQTLQVVKNPLLVLQETLRIGRFAIVGFPNFGHWRLRWGLFLGGRAPKSHALPFEWYDTPNIRVLTVTDFRDYCRREQIHVVRDAYLIGSRWHKASRRFSANIMAQAAMFVITRSGTI
ncbi:MAG: methionine biosynthesis protein MetW [Desulfobacteraceae bacterium]|nr:methionine biosynthesis protein MetW [Desulfobacteraceae bacterium]